MRLVIVLLISIISTFTIKAQERLEPVNDFFIRNQDSNEYYAIVQKKLFAGLSYFPKARLVIMPSFAGEGVLEVERHISAQNYTITFRQAEKSIWYAKNRDSVQIKTYTRKITAQSAMLLHNLYIRATMLAGYPDYKMNGSDGVQYYFTACNEGVQNATVWSPRKGTATEELVNINIEIIRLVTKDNSIISFNASLEKRIHVLMMRLMPGYKDNYSINMPDGFPVTDKMLQERPSPTSDKDEAWFLSTEEAMLVFKLSPKNKQLATFYFSLSKTPKAFLEEMQEKIDVRLNTKGKPDIDSLSYKQRFSPAAFFFTSNKGFYLGDSRKIIVSIYGNPDESIILQGIERCKWNISGQKVVMFFEDDKLAGMILYNESNATLKIILIANIVFLLITGLIFFRMSKRKKQYTYTFLAFSLLFLTGCGRRHNGSMVNDTGETLTVTLKLNYPYTDARPDNYFRENIIDGVKVSSPEEAKTAADYTISYDPLTETAVLRLQPEDRINLGTVRMGGPTRDNYQSWEFTEITCRGSNGYYMRASGPQIMDYVNKPFWALNTYEFAIE